MWWPAAAQRLGGDIRVWSRAVCDRHRRSQTTSAVVRMRLLRALHLSWATDSRRPRGESTRLQQTEGYPFNPRKWAVPQTDPQPWLESWWTSGCATRRLSMRISGQAPGHDARRRRPKTSRASPWVLSRRNYYVLLGTMQPWRVAGPRETLPSSSPGLPIRTVYDDRAGLDGRWVSVPELLLEIPPQTGRNGP